MSANLKVYKIAGSYWAQRPLLFEKSEQVRNLTKVHFPTGTGSMNDKPVGEFLDKFASSELAKELIPLLLSPHSPTPYHRWRNARALRRGVTLEKLYTFMDEQTYYQVVVDFFVLKARPLMRLLGLQTGWKSPLRRMLKKLNPFTTRSSSSVSPEGTLHEHAQSHK
jgi:hypothetical protein